VARAEILARLRAARPPGPAARAAPAQSWPQPERPSEAFATALVEAGGEGWELSDPPALAAALGRRAEERGWRAVASGVEGLSLPPPSPDPRAAAALDLAVLPGRFAVAENGAVWVEEGDLPPPGRALLFLPEHVVLVLRPFVCVPHLHAAYERLAFGHRGYGVFVAGPSKTADIEQALVVGAHGPRSLVVAALER